MPGSQCAPVSILLPRHGISHSNRGGTGTAPQTAPGADLALLTCGSNGRRDNSLLASPSGHCSPARSTPGGQRDRLRTAMPISQAGNGCTWLTNCPHLLEQHQVKALVAQRVPDEPDALLPPLAQVPDGPARQG